MSVLSRIIRLFRAPPPLEVLPETEREKKALDRTIKRAEETVEMVNRRSEVDRQRAHRLVRATNEVAEHLNQAWGP